jgi:hypothetical protein
MSGNENKKNSDEKWCKFLAKFKKSHPNHSWTSDHPRPVTPSTLGSQDYHHGHSVPSAIELQTPALSPTSLVGKILAHNGSDMTIKPVVIISPENAERIAKLKVLQENGFKMQPPPVNLISFGPVAEQRPDTMRIDTVRIIREIPPPKPAPKS